MSATERASVTESGGTSHKSRADQLIDIKEETYSIGEEEDGEDEIEEMDGMKGESDKIESKKSYSITDKSKRIRTDDSSCLFYDSD